MMSNIAITDFCIVVEQESMSKPVFWHLMFKGFLVAISLIKFISTKSSPFEVSGRTSSHKLETWPLYNTALYY